MIKLITILFFFARSVVTPEMFGARGLPFDDALPLQKAADSVVKVNGILDLTTNNNGYKTTKTINFEHPQGKFFTVSIRGNYSYGGVMTSRFIADFKAGPAINIQNGRGCEIEGIYFQGNYKVPNQSMLTPYEKYGDTTCQDTRYEQYVAIAIDGKATGTGSSATTIRNCLFTNFTGGIIYSPNGQTLMNDLNVIERVVFTNLKFAFAGCQAQEKMNVIRTIKIGGNVRTLFVFNWYGQQHPGQYKISDVNAAGHVGSLIYRKSLGFFQIIMENIFAEALYSIGYWDAGTKKDALINADINLIHPTISGAFADADIDGNGVSFENCDIRYYGQHQFPVMLDGNYKLTNTDPAGRYIPFIKGMYNTGQDPTFKIIPITRSGITISDERKTILFNSVPSTGDIIVFTEMGNNAWAGRAEVESNSGKAVVLRYISFRVEQNKTYQIGIFKSN